MLSELLDFLSRKELVISLRDIVTLLPPVVPSGGTTTTGQPQSNSTTTTPLPPIDSSSIHGMLLESWNNTLSPNGAANYGGIGPLQIPTFILPFIPGFSRDSSVHIFDGYLFVAKDGDYNFRFACCPAGYLVFDGETIWDMERSTEGKYVVTPFTRTLKAGKPYRVNACLVAMSLSYKGLELKWNGPGINVELPGDTSEKGFAFIPTLNCMPPQDWRARIKDFSPPVTTTTTGIPVVVVPQFIPPQPDPLIYQTPALDILFAELIPDNSPYRLKCFDAEIDPNSAKIMAAIGNLHLHPILGPGIGIPYMLVDDKTSLRPVSFWVSTESDNGAYPIVNNPVLENEGVRFPEGEGEGKPENDVHYIAIDTASKMEYDIYQLEANQDRDVDGFPASWRAYAGAVFNLAGDVPRKKGNTSGDAAGLPIFPYLIRYEELIAGVIEHPIRISVPFTDESFVYPALHFTNKYPNSSYPPMGAVLRLKRDFSILPYHPWIQTILIALKVYGGIVADNGSNFVGIMGCPDSRLDNKILEQLRTVFTFNSSVNNFDVIKMIDRTYRKDLEGT